MLHIPSAQGWDIVIEKQGTSIYDVLSLSLSVFISAFVLL